MMSNCAILCVDDEVTILDTLKEQLQRRFGDRYIYEVAEDVSEAWEVIEDLIADDIKILIIISDWLMPEVKGDEFLIAVHQQYPDTVAVMLTGQADENAIDRVRKQANLYACLRKPWSEEDLVTVVRSALR